MARRIITAREQVQLLGAWRTGAKYYHLTDDPDFTLNPDYHPDNNTTLGGSWHTPGLFVGDRPEAWFTGYQYHRPYVAEFDIPDHIFEQDDVMAGGGYSGERFIPSKHFPHITHTRTIPYDAYVREEFGSHGPTERATGLDFETGQPITVPGGNLRAFPEGYQYSGSEVTKTPEWRENYRKVMDQYHRAEGSEFSGGWDAYEHPLAGTYDWDPEGSEKMWYSPATGKYHHRDVSFRGVQNEVEPKDLSDDPWPTRSARRITAFDDWEPNRWGTGFESRLENGHSLFVVHSTDKPELGWQWGIYDHNHPDPEVRNYPVRKGGALWGGDTPDDPQDHLPTAEHAKQQAIEHYKKMYPIGTSTGGHESGFDYDSFFRDYNPRNYQ